jgi:outer membrane cobalamin receptor
MIKNFLTLALLLALSTEAAAQETDLDYFDFERASLADILDRRTSVASRLEFAGREAPALVTVLSREELQHSGARNLVDALLLVPGLEFGVDVEGNLGLGIRGNWAHEGKVLVLVDGQRYNEAFFGTAQLERISIEQVEKIEVIRGPGSAVYGGSAGLGVVKITTRGAKALDGASAAAAYGAMSRGGRGGSFNLAYGLPAAGAELTAQLYLAGADRGDRRYADFNGGAYNMRDASDLKTRNLNLGFKRGGYSARLIADQYRTTQRDHYDDTILPRPLARNFDAYFAELSREFTLNESLSVTPSLNYSYQEPYHGYDAVYYPRDKRSQYLKGTVNAVYAVSPRAKLSGGLELSADFAELASPTTAFWYFTGGKRSIDYGNSAIFFEGVAETLLGTFSAGARYDKHEKFAPAFSPRLAWTKALDFCHLKAVYSRAFRAPGIDNLDANPDLKPEKTSVAEVEAGFQPASDFYLAASVFDIRIDKPIVFYVQNGAQRYGNYGETGTHGLELTARVKKDWGYATLGYSHYAAYDNKVAFYSSGGSGALLGFARNKVTLNSSFNVSRNFSVNPSGVFYSGRRGYYAAGAARRFADKLQANLNFQLDGLAGGKLSLGLGVFDIFDSGYAYLQPYNGAHSPLPAPSREVRAKLNYKF